MKPMMKRTILFVLCLQIVLSTMIPFVSFSGEGLSSLFQGKSNPTVNPSANSVIVPEMGTTVTSIFPETKLEWTSYRDYVLNEAKRIWEDPKAYEGYEVVFNSRWGTLFCRAGFGASTRSDGVLITEEMFNSIFVVEESHYDKDSDTLWFKLAGKDGKPLPSGLAEKPYVLYVYGSDITGNTLEYNSPTVFLLPRKAILRPDPEDEITMYASPSAGAATEKRPVSDFPALVDYTPVMLAITDGLKVNFYDLGEAYGQYRYVEAERLQLISAEASAAYQRIVESKDLYEYYQNIYDTPTSVLEQFSQLHKDILDITVEELAELEKKVVSTTVEFQGKTLPVTVRGNLPDYVRVNATLVSNEVVMSAGFNIESAEDIIVALDITMTNTLTGDEWQPEEGRIVTVSIGVEELGYATDSIVRAHRKHGDQVQDFNLIVVEDGFVNLHVDGFSVYAVSRVGDTPPNNATALPQSPNNQVNPVELQVGEAYFFYARGTWSGRNPPQHGYNRSAWHVVSDNLGAIHYTVHSNSNIGSGGIPVPWITIHPLKETVAEEGAPVDQNYVTLQFIYDNNNSIITENYKLKIIAPEVDTAAGETVKLYLKDDVNKTGRIVATLIGYNDTGITWYDKEGRPLEGNEGSYDITDGAYDKDGNMIHAGLDGSSLSWSRDDGYFIVPTAYDDKYRSVNIAVDHAGLVEARKNDDETAFDPTTYTLKVVLADSTPLEAKYTVYYQSEIINADFEFPNAPDENYSFFPNGWPELYWKTTAPGHTSNNRENISKDIEYGDVVDGECATDFGVVNGADGSHQFAELNAEAFGTLYQDIISVPGEDIFWEFAHAPRPDQSGGWTVDDISNAMYIVIGPTEEAQKLDNTNLAELRTLAQAKAVADGMTKAQFAAGTTPVKVIYDDIEYMIWYHDAGNHNPGTTTTWTDLAGTYEVPSNQYRTRLFFMSEPSTNQNALNTGNLIDSAAAGQYKTYLIEYYLGKVDANNELVLERYTGKQEGKALVYSFVDLEYLSELMTEQNQYLHRILINADNYPYSIRHVDRVTGKEKESLYIDKYPGKVENVESYDKEHNPDYSQYDIVMQVFLREVVISVEKEIMFPTNSKGEQLLTEEQKLDLIEGRAENDKYTVEFKVSADSTGDGYQYSETGTASIIKRSPTGDYVGYYAVESHPKGGYWYTIEETIDSEKNKPTELPGLILDEVIYSTTLYRNGMHLTKDELIAEGYTDGVVTNRFELTTRQGDRLGINFAEVVVKNYYVEKQTTIKYVAVGNGKVAFGGDKSNFVDTPTETLAYYSGKATGADVSPGKGATFVGWFTDPACTPESRVTLTDGVVGVNPKVPGSSENYFIPNANIMDAEEVTFYAKFETASITIERENALPNQTFVYHIKNGADTPELDMYVTLQCDENGKGKVEIFEMLLGNYTVTECEDWSWRHPTGTQSGTLTAEDNSHTFEFDGKPDDMEWLNDYSDSVPNIFDRNVTP